MNPVTIDVRWEPWPDAVQSWPACPKCDEPTQGGRATLDGDTVWAGWLCGAEGCSGVIDAPTSAPVP